MAYKALYRTYRPSTFEDVVGQQHIVKTLQNAIKNNKIAHAYLFCGPRGTGKTTVAKLLGKAVNCLNSPHEPCNTCDNCKAISAGNHPDIVEIDAASNNGVDEIRDLIEKVKYSPLQGKYKVYIVDEVHMLSQGAFNALLKTLEEPPSHVIFILATTEPHKVIPTIISRCQRFDFTKVPALEIAVRIEEVLKKEKIKYGEGVVRLVSQLAEGGLRDALSILEQCIAYAQNDIQIEHVYDIYGITTVNEKLSLLEAVFEQKVESILDKVRYISEKSFDIKRLTADLIDLLKECVIYQYTEDENLLQMCSVSEVKRVLQYCDAECCLKMIDVLIDTIDKYRFATNIHSYFEVCLLKMMTTAEKIVIVEKVAESVKTSIKVVDTVSKSTPKLEKIKNDTQKDQPIEGGEETVLTQKKEVDVPSLNLTVEKRPELSDLELIRYFVANDKPTRSNHQETWKSLSDFADDLSWAKIAKMLEETKIMACNEAFIVVSSFYQEIVNQINDPVNDEDIRRLIQRLFGAPKSLIAITDDQAKRSVELFTKLNQNNELPEPIEVSLTKLPESSENTTKVGLNQATMDLFGNVIDIIHEE